MLIKTALRELHPRLPVTIGFDNRSQPRIPLITPERISNYTKGRSRAGSRNSTRPLISEYARENASLPPQVLSSS